MNLKNWLRWRCERSSVLSHTGSETILAKSETDVVGMNETKGRGEQVWVLFRTTKKMKLSILKTSWYSLTVWRSLQVWNLVQVESLSREIRVGLYIAERSVLQYDIDQGAETRYGMEISNMEWPSTNWNMNNSYNPIFVGLWRTLFSCMESIWAAPQPWGSVRLVQFLSYPMHSTPLVGVKEL